METGDWMVSVFSSDTDDVPVAGWFLRDRTEDEASSEALAEVTSDFPYAADWSIAPVSK